MNQDTFQKYSEIHGIRFTGKQKAAARQALSEEFEAFGYSSEVQSKRNLILKAHNLVFGNLKSSRYVIVVPYDTPGHIFWPKYHYYPLDGNKTQAKATIPTYGPIVIFYFLFLGLLYLLPALSLNVYAYMAMSVVTIIVFIMMFILLFRGVPNKRNVNRNTSGIIAALQLAEGLSKDQRRQVSFVFTDRNENRHFGSKMLADIFKNNNKNPMVIVLNCIGTGGKLMVGALNGNKKVASEIIKKYKGDEKPAIAVLTPDMLMQSPMSYFTKCVTIARGDIDEKGNLVVENTGSKRDTAVDEAGIDAVSKMLIGYFQGLK